MEGREQTEASGILFSFMEDCLGRVKIKVCEMGRSKKNRIGDYCHKGLDPPPNGPFFLILLTKVLKFTFFNPSQGHHQVFLNIDDNDLI